MEELQRLAVRCSTRAAAKPTFAASGLRCRIGAAQPPKCATWLTSACLQTREVVGGRAVHLRREVAAPEVLRSGSTRTVEEWVQAHVWVDGAIEKGEVRRYLARCARVAEDDVSLPDGVWGTPSVEGGLCTQVRIRRPCLHGLAELSASPFESAARLRSGVRIGDLAAAGAPPPSTPAVERGGETPCRVHPRDADGVVESSVLLYDLRAPAAAVEAQMTSLREYGFLNYIPVHPLLAQLAQAHGRVPEAEASALYQLGVESSALLKGLDERLITETTTAENGQAPVGPVLEYLQDAADTMHPCAVGRYALRYVVAVAAGLPHRQAFEASDVARLLPAVRAALVWNRRATARAEEGFAPRVGDAVYDAAAGCVRRVATDGDAAAFSPLDLVLRESDPAGSTGYRALISLPSTLDAHVEASPYLRLVSDPEKQAWGAAPPSWYLAGDEGLRMMKAVAGEDARTRPAEGREAQQSTAASLAVRMRLPAGSHVLAAMYGAFDVVLHPGTWYTAQVAYFNRLL